MKKITLKIIAAVTLTAMMMTASSCSRVLNIFDREITMPKDKFIDELTDTFCAGNPTMFSFTAKGEFDTSTIGTSLFDAYRYVEKYAKGNDETADALGLISDSIAMFGVTSTDHKNSKEYDRELVYESIRRGIELVIEDEKCQDYLLEGMKNNVASVDAPFAFDISISPNTEKSAYVIVEGRAADGKMHFHTGDMINLDDSPENVLFGDLTYYAETLAAGNNKQEITLEDGGDEAQRFFEKLKEIKNEYLTEPSGKTWYEGSIRQAEEGALRVYSDSALESSFQYLGDSTWFMSDLITEGETFTITDSKVNDALLEELCMALATGIINKGNCPAPKAFDGDIKVDTQSSVTTPGLKIDPAVNSESRYLYAGDRSCVNIQFDIDGRNCFYMEGLYHETDAVIQGTPYVENPEFYEFIKYREKAFCRHDTYDVYYPAYGFEGSTEPEFLPDKLLNDGTFIKAYKAVCGDIEYLLENYKIDDKDVFVFTDRDGKIVSGFSYNKEGLTLCVSHFDTTIESEIKEIYDHASTHSEEVIRQQEAETAKISAMDSSDFVAEDLWEMGLPDLEGEFVKGESIDDPHIVSDFKDYLKDNPPFTIEMVTLGDSKKVMYKGVSDGKLNFFVDEDHRAHRPGDTSYRMIECFIDGISYIIKHDNSWYATDYSGERIEDKAKDVLYEMGEALSPIYDLEFSCAYKATLDGEEYIVEVWENRGIEYMYFCKDNKIVGVRYTSAFGALLYSYILDFKKEADMSLIKAPDMPAAGSSMEE